MLQSTIPIMGVEAKTVDVIEEAMTIKNIGKPVSTEIKAAAKTVGKAEKKIEEGAKKETKRGKNWLPDEGKPNSMETNASGTTTKKYGPDGKVQKEYNQGHPEVSHRGTKNAQDHVHDYKPSNHPKRSPERMLARTPKRNEFKKDQAKTN